MINYFVFLVFIYLPSWSIRIDAGRKSSLIVSIMKFISGVVSRNEQSTLIKELFDGILVLNIIYDSSVEHWTLT